MMNSDDRKLWNLEMLAKASEILLEQDIVDIATRKQVVVKVKQPSSSSLIPEWLGNVMSKEGIDAYDPKLIIRRKLYASDINNGQSRLSLPFKQVVHEKFLTEEETRVIREQSILKTNKDGVRVVLVDPLLNKHEIDLRKWKIGGSWNYVLVNNWNDVVTSNKFKVNHITEIWSFRNRDGQLCLAMSPLVKDPGSFGKKNSRCLGGKVTKGFCFSL